jgi:hypothetical protein
MTKNHHAMLSPVLDVMRASQPTVPVGNHPSFQKLWNSEIQSTLSEISDVAEFTPQEKQQAKKIANLVSDAPGQIDVRRQNMMAYLKPAWRY